MAKAKPPIKLASLQFAVKCKKYLYGPFANAQIASDWAQNRFVTSYPPSNWTIVKLHAPAS